MEKNTIWNLLTCIICFMGLNVNITYSVTSDFNDISRSGINNLPIFKPRVACYQFSSYDKSGGNDDGFSGNNGVLYLKDSKYVIFDAFGPGIINRIWFIGIEYTGRIQIYFNDELLPRIDMPVDEFFSGTVSPFLFPLTGNDRVSSGGYFNYVPIVFDSRLVVMTTGQPR